MSKTRYIQPRKYDLEVTYKINGVQFISYVDVRMCGHCFKWTVFERSCPVCGRFQVNQHPVYFQIIRMNVLRLVGAAQPDKKAIAILADLMKEKGVPFVNPNDEEPEPA